MHLKTDTSANQHFAQVPTISHSRNGFSIAQKHVTTMQFDTLYPLHWKYIYPGDTLSISQSLMARLTTQTIYLYDDLYFDMHAWFVPLRLIQTNWARYQFNAQPSGPSQDNSSLTSPKIDLAALGSGGFPSKSLYDIFGFPTLINLSANVEHINNYLGRAYNFIFNNDYRDENLQNAVVVDLDDGPDLASDYVLLKAGKRHDKFTSCLPFQQKGAAVTLPIGTTAPVKAVVNSSVTPIFHEITTGNLTDGTVSGETGTGRMGVGSTFAYMDPNTTLYTDLMSAVAPTLNLVRQSFAIQHLLEADARGGTRDVESIKHRWGVTVPDFRLQRPEYLGGQTFSFDGHIVPQTSETATTPQANLASFSQGMTRFQINHSFVEHGVFMILLRARSNQTYQQGLMRELSYKTRYDWIQPEFANLGEVAVKNKEIYMTSSDSDNNGTFGFQEYGYEARYSENRVTGEMRSNFPQSRDREHMADDYGSLPTLGSAWIQSNTPIGRNITVEPETADPIEINALTSGSIVRTLPMYSIPGLKRL